MVINPLIPFRKLRRGMTFDRWRTDYWQLWFVSLLAGFSISQLVFGATAGTTLADSLDDATTTVFAAVNLLGAFVVLIGLHMRNTDAGLEVELWGNISLNVTMVVWVGLIIFANPFPYSSYGLGFGEAFVLANVQRVYMIWAYKTAKKRKGTLEIELRDAMADTLVTEIVEREE